VPEIPGHPAAVNAGTVTVLKGRHTCCATPLGWLELVKQRSRGHHHRRPLGFRDDETPRLPLVGGDDTLGWPRQIGEDAADAQIKLAGVLISRFA